MLIHELDNIDKQILNDIQWTFPLVDRPFLELVKKYHITEDEIIHRIKKLKETGIIRQISAIFDTRKLGVQKRSGSLRSR